MSHCLAEEPGGRATHWVAVHPLAIIRQRFSTQGMLPSWRNAMFADAHHTIGYLSRNKFIQGQKIKPFRHFFACCVGAKVLDHGMNMTCSKRHFMQAPMQALTLLLLGAIEDGGGGICTWYLRVPVRTFRGIALFCYTAMKVLLTFPGSEIVQPPCLPHSNWCLKWMAVQCDIPVSPHWGCCKAIFQFFKSFFAWSVHWTTAACFSWFIWAVSWLCCCTNEW